jgi:hypothetical protein
MEEEAQQKPVPGKPSQVPSWITLGFVLGALSVLALPKPAPAPPPRAAVEEAPKPAKAPEAPRMTTIEAVFTEWDKFAVWNDDRTEVALWDSDTKSFSDCYEVVRNANGYFFRSIPGLTQPLLTHGVAENSPLQFTETARQRQEWIDAVSRQNWNAIAQGAHDALNPTPKPEEGK